MIELDDLLANYPSIDEPEFQKLIASKAEFQELSSFPEEAKPSKEKIYYKHQLWFARYMEHYERAFYIAKPGTGKTCSISAMEHLDRINNGGKRKIYFLTNRTQRDDFKKQIVCSCTDGYFLTEKIKYPEAGIPGSEVDPARSQKNAVNSSIHRRYVPIGYKAFANIISGDNFPYTPEGEEKLRETFSGHDFVIDEVQNIKINPEKDFDTKNQRFQVYAAIWRLMHVLDRSRFVLLSATPSINKVNELTSHLNLLLPLNKQLDNKVIRKVVEFVGFQGRIPDDKYHFVNLTDEAVTRPDDYGNLVTVPPADLETLKPFFQGYFLYVDSFNIGVVRDYGRGTYGTYDPESQITTTHLEMSSFQSIVYLLEKMKQKSSELNKATYVSLTTALGFVFPNGTVPSSTVSEIGMDSTLARYITIDPKTDSARFVQFSPQPPADYRSPLLNDPPLPDTNIDLKYAVARPEILRVLSIKDHYSLGLCMNSDRKIYISTILVASRAYLFGLILEEYGFERFEEKQSVFTSNRSSAASYCPTSDASRRVKNSFPKKKRYALITGRTGARMKEIIFELFNSPDNLDGEYIRVIIITKVGQYGINLKEIGVVIVEEPKWNPGDLEQSVDRAFRTDSYFLSAKRRTEQLFSQSNYEPESSEPIRIPIYLYEARYNRNLTRDLQFYIHRQVIPTNYRWEQLNIDPNSSTIDGDVWRYAQGKDRILKRVLRIEKQLAVDCPNHKARNVRRAVEDFTPQCDYDVCNYQCSDGLSPEVDYSTYNVYYRKEAVDEARVSIIQYFTEFSSGSITDIRTKYPNIKADLYVCEALEQLMRDRVRIYNRFGFSSYIKEYRGIFYVTHDYPSSQDRDPGSFYYYDNRLIGVRRKDVNEVLRDSISSSVNAAIQYFKSNGDKNLLFNYLNSRDEIYRSTFLERIILTYVLRQDATESFIQFYQNVREYFGAKVIQMFKPDFVIKELARRYREPEKKRGPATAEKSKTSIKNIPSSLEDLAAEQNQIDRSGSRDRDEIYFHTIITGSSQTQSEHGKGARAAKAISNIRVLTVPPLNVEQLSEENLEWKDADNLHSQIYNFYAQRQNQSLEEQFQMKLNQSQCYGIISSDRLEIIHKGYENTVKATGNKKHKRTGRDIGSFNIDDIIEFMYALRIYPPTNVPPDFNRYTALASLTARKVKSKPVLTNQGYVFMPPNSWDDGRLYHYYYWYNFGDSRKYKKNDYAMIIQEFLLNNSLILYRREGAEALLRKQLKEYKESKSRF